MMRLAQVIHFFQGHRYRREILAALVVKLVLMVVIAGYCFAHKSPEPPPSPLLEEGWGDPRF